MPRSVCGGGVVALEGFVVKVNNSSKWIQVNNSSKWIAFWKMIEDQKRARKDDQPSDQFNQNILAPTVGPSDTPMKP
ncbi:hypothetical protein LR48_Vigan06g081400 [Vigna angularis]|uniref:Uncharacterized protein n=1 Tax=Phaseolus angularis TaxID=3914 RepID=A0A0L9URZ3_PHAAN|nr:hypothetical protein LR48_Vigan06g081400 [Vigna angularis]